MNIEQIESFLASYSDAWIANDKARMSDHWDQEDQEPFYKAEEFSDFFHSFDEVNKYWAHNESLHEEMCQKMSDISFKSLPGGYAILFFRMQWYLKFAEGTKTSTGTDYPYAGKSLGGENQVVGLLRETENGLKLAGWSETPNSPINYVTMMYQWSAESIYKKIKSYTESQIKSL